MSLLHDAALRGAVFLLAKGLIVGLSLSVLRTRNTIPRIARPLPFASSLFYPCAAVPRDFMNVFLPFFPRCFSFFHHLASEVRKIRLGSCRSVTFFVASFSCLFSVEVFFRDREACLLEPRCSRMMLRGVSFLRIEGRDSIGGISCVYEWDEWNCLV